MNLTALGAARLTGLSVRMVNDVYPLLRRRLPQFCPVPVELGGALRLDESYFGPRWGAANGAGEWAAKPIAFGLFKRGGQVHAKIVPDCSNGLRCMPR